MQQHPTLRSWLWVHFKIGALSVGAAARLPLYEEAMVHEYRWLTANEFQEVLTLAQMMPGPNLVNFAACAGARLVSWPLNLLGILLLVSPGAALAVLIYQKVPLDNPDIKALFNGFAIGAFLLTGRFLWQLARSLTPSDEQAKNRSAPGRRRNGRIGLAALIFLVCLAQLPLMKVIAVSEVVCLAWEFLS